MLIQLRDQCVQCTSWDGWVTETNGQFVVKCGVCDLYQYNAPKKELGMENEPVNVKPIPTHYAGHFFRSRLEARWAVFFDHVGIDWLYESQGYEIGLDPKGTSVKWYLPDFYLPDFDTWVEVKPRADMLDRSFLASCVIPHGGGLPGNGLLLLHNINKKSVNFLTLWYRLRFDKGDIYCDDIEFGDFGLSTWMSWCCGNDSTWTVDTDITHGPGSHVMESCEVFPGDLPRKAAADAYRAALSARFEHGESGYAA